MMVLDSSKTALIIVDMQNGVCKENGSLVRLLNMKEPSASTNGSSSFTKEPSASTNGSSSFTKEPSASTNGFSSFTKELRGAKTYPKILALKKHAKELGMPVIYVKTVFNEDYSNAGMLGKRFPLKEIGHFKVDSWDSEIVEELHPSDDDLLVVKDRWSAFFNTNLDALLKEHEVENIIITGGATDVCVLETATMGFFLDYNCVVPTDATFSFSDESERIGIAQLSFGRAIVTTTDEAISALQ